MAVGRQTIKSKSTCSGQKGSKNDKESVERRKRPLEKDQRKMKSVLRPGKDKISHQLWNGLVAFAVTANLLTGQASGMPYCPEIQTAELGKLKTIVCNFPLNSSSVYWYDGAPPEGPPFITYFYDSHQKRNTGFLNNSFDVSQNGSLVILEVHAEHERNYTTIVYIGQYQFEKSIVSLRVVAYPPRSNPHIACANCQQNYYHVHEGEDTLTCQLNMSRPPAQLEWVKWSPDKYSPVKGQNPINTVGNKDGTFNSSRTISLTRSDLHPITDLFCIASWDTQQTIGDIEIVVDFTNSQSFQRMDHDTLYKEVNKTSVLTCSESVQSVIVWKRLPHLREPETIGFCSSNIRTKTTKLNGMEISEDGNLIFPDMQIEYEGRYACLYGNGEGDEIILKKQVAVVPPSPPYVEIKGCSENDMGRCELREENTDRVECAVYGTRPDVFLQWIALKPNYVYLSPPKVSVTETGDTFDVAVETTFKINADVPCGEELWLECNLYGPVGDIIKPNRVVQIIPGSCNTKKSTGKFLVIGLFSVVGLSITAIFFIKKRRCRHILRHAGVISSVKYHSHDEDGQDDTQIYIGEGEKRK